jgi:hypothetical protein
MPEEIEVLYVVHAQGPDDLYAAATKEEAEALAAQQNDLVPLAKCVVIVSPWSPVDHWKTLAEQNAEDAKYLRNGWQNDLNQLNDAKAEIIAQSKNVIDMTREDFDATLNNLRRMGASIDGDNAYKRDLCDSIAGAMAFGYQNTNHPPEGHWARRFWDMGRAEGEMREALTAALKLTRENLHACQAVIHYAGGFDPAYVNDAQAAMKNADEVLAKYPPLNPA